MHYRKMIVVRNCIC